MYATTATGHRPHISKSKDSKVLQAMSLNGVYARLIQTTTTTTEEWLGLSYTDADSLCIASESSTLNGVTRNYLGSASLKLSVSATSSWFRVEGCWGTVVSTQIQRMNDTNCYRVSRTTQILEVSNTGGTLELV